MNDLVGQNKFENSDEDQIMQNDDPGYNLVQDRSGSPRERNMEERQAEQSNPENQSLEVQDLLGA